MTIVRPEQSSGELHARVVVTAGGGPYQVTVDVSSDPNATGRLMVGGQALAAPGRVLQAVYAVLHGIYGGGTLV